MGCIVGYSGDKMLVVGTAAQGVWIGKEKEKNSLQRVLRGVDVTQVDVIQSHNILLVLAGLKKKNYQRNRCSSVFIL